MVVAVAVVFQFQLQYLQFYYIMRLMMMMMLLLLLMRRSILDNNMKKLVELHVLKCQHNKNDTFKKIFYFDEKKLFKRNHRAQPASH